MEGGGERKNRDNQKREKALTEGTVSLTTLLPSKNPFHDPASVLILRNNQHPVEGQGTLTVPEKVAELTLGHLSFLKECIRLGIRVWGDGTMFAAAAAHELSR